MGSCLDIYSLFNNGCLSFRNEESGFSHCFVVTQINHCTVPYAEMPDAQLPMTKLPKHFFLFNCIQLFLKNGRIVANGAHRV